MLSEFLIRILPNVQKNYVQHTHTRVGDIIEVDFATKCRFSKYFVMNWKARTRYKTNNNININDTKIDLKHFEAHCVAQSVGKGGRCEGATELQKLKFNRSNVDTERKQRGRKKKKQLSSQRKSLASFKCDTNRHIIYLMFSCRIQWQAKMMFRMCIGSKSFPVNVLSVQWLTGD